MNKTPNYQSGLQETTEDDNSVCEQLHPQTQSRSTAEKKKVKKKKETKRASTVTDHISVTGCEMGHRAIYRCHDVHNYETNMNTIKPRWGNGLKEHCTLAPSTPPPSPRLSPFPKPTNALRSKTN